MSLFPAIEVLLAEQGRKYNSPDQAGGLREMMLDICLGFFLVIL